MRVGFGSVILLFVGLEHRHPLHLSRYHGDAVACMVRLSFPHSRNSLRTAFLLLLAFAYAAPGLASAGTLIFKILTLCRVYY